MKRIAVSAAVAALLIFSVPASAQIAGPINVTPRDCSGTITLGGTAQPLFAVQGNLHGFQLTNIDTVAEPLWFSLTGTAAAGAVGSYPLTAATVTTFAGAGSYTTPPGLGLNTAVSIIGATTAHKYSCTWW